MPAKGYKLSEDAKRRISAALTGRPGHPQSEETRQKISLARKGRQWSDETRLRYSKTARDGRRKGANHPGWKGGRKRHLAGYIQIWVPGHPRANSRGYVLEHLVVWEQYTGKPIPKGYSIHHLNGSRDDNRFENLAMMRAGEHIHQGIIYRRRILELEKQVRELQQLKLAI